MNKLTKAFSGVQGAVFSKKAPWSPKARRCKAIFILFLLSTISLLCQAEKGIKDMSYEELVKKYEKLDKVKNFLESETSRKYPWSMNKFFDSRIYGRLIGNEFFGYYYDEGIEYGDKSNRIAIDTIAVIKGRGYEKYKDIFTRIFLETLALSKKQTYYVDKQSRYSIGICIVSVKEKDDVESSKGIVLESYIKDRKTGKYFYHRCGTGSQGKLEQAMMFSAARIICNLEYLKQKALDTFTSFNKNK
jgi:hypothetical protein